MKTFNTVMKELLNVYKEGDREYYWYMQDNADSLLEKEKEQIKKIAVDFFHWNNKKMLTNGNSKIEDAFDEFYKQILNQNK